MIPILYKSAEVDFTTNGLGLLNDIYSVDIQEQRNGLLTLTASYPTNAKHYKEIETGRIIYAKPNPLDGAQAFRIVKTELDISGYNLNIEADHITYDLTHNLVKEVHLQGDGQNAMTHLQNATVTPHLFRFVSDLQHLGDSRLQYVNPMEAIAGTEGSILQIWGGELHRDNRTVSMLSRRGRDNFTTFRLGKNINGLKYTVDMSNVTTRIVPTVTKSDATDNDKAYFVVGDTVDSKNLNKYPNVYIQHVDMGEKVTINEGETDEQIKAKIDKQAKNWFTQSANTGIDLPQVTVEIDVTSLQDSADYQEKFRNLESVGLTDTVSVYVPEFNVNVTAIVNELHYDPVAERVTSLVVGTSKKSFADNNSNALAELQNSITQIRQDATTAIVSSNGKNTNYYGTEEPAHPVEGDLWFKQVGDETYLMIFKDGRWQEWVSTKTQEEIAKKVDDAIKKANDYTDELNEKQAEEVQKFQSEANSALSEAAAERTVFSSNAASMATSAATHADSMANSAAAYGKTQAASALSEANSALTTAKSDLTDDISVAKSEAIEAAKTADGLIHQEVTSTASSITRTISQNKSEADGKISTAQTTATHALDGLKAKVDQTTYNDKTGQLDRAVGSAALTADSAALSIKNYQSLADGKLSSQAAAIDVNSKAIKTKVSQSDYNDKTDDLTEKYGQVKATADAVRTDVAKYKESNDGKVSANAANIETLSGQITSKVSQTVFNEKTGELSGKYSETKQTVEKISNTVTELQAKANAQGQVNQLMNTEFTPDLQGWTLQADTGSNAPYASYATYGSRGIGFNTVNADANTFARLSQTVSLPSTRLETDIMSLSWRVNTRRMDNYCHIWLAWQDDKGNNVADYTMGNWNDSNLNKYNVLKWENISIPIEAKQVDIRFETREGTNAYIFQPMLVFADHVGDYVAGNYNNNARVAALEVDLDHITGLVNDPKKGLSATATLAANGLSVATTAQSDAATAIQTAKGVQTKVERMGGVNLLANTEFNPDLEGWEDASDASSPKPYLTGVDKNVNSRVIGFKTGDTVNNTYARLLQWVSTGSDSPNISLSWMSFASAYVTGKANIYLGFADSNGKVISSAQHTWINPGVGWETYKWENISLPSGTRKIKVSFEAIGGVTAAYLGHPMLVFGSKVGTYVPGNYNNNDSMQSMRTQLADQITDEIKNRKTGDSSIVTQLTGLIDQKVMSVEEGYQSAITQSANGILASVSQPNRLFNTQFTPDLDGWNITNNRADGKNHNFYRSYIVDGETVVGVDVPDNAGSDSSKYYAYFEQDVALPGNNEDTVLSITHDVRTVKMTHYASLWITFRGANKEIINNGDSNVLKFWDGNEIDGKWYTKKYENIKVPKEAKYVRVSFQSREGMNAYLKRPMLVFRSVAADYMPGPYSGMNTSTVLELFKDNWALGIADNSGKLISGINGDTSGTVIQGKKLVINSDTTINGKAFIDGSVIKNASIGTAQIGKAAVGSAQIINVDVSKISGNIANFITANINTLNAKVLYGDTGHLGTTDTGRVINKQDNHLQLASKGMYNSANDRAQLELLSHTNDIDANMQGSFNYYSDVRKGHGLGIRLAQNQILAIDEDGGSKMLYLSPYQGGEVRVVSRDKQAYYPMRASSFNAMSERSSKSNIEPFKDCALDIVKNTKVRHYTKNGKSEVGVISDEADPRLLTEDQHAVSLYDYTSVLYKAVQELIEEVEKLKNGKSNSE